jgi:transcriptional antiterminator NusG
LPSRNAWKRMLAAIRAGRLNQCDKPYCEKKLWKNLHPSEDSEALSGSATSSVAVSHGSGAVDDSALGGWVNVGEGNASARDAKWFAVYTTCRHEKRVAQHLSQRAIEHYLPLYRSQRRWRDGSRVTLDLPLFPSYIFVRIGRGERADVLQVPGALAVVGGTRREPAPVEDAAIEALRLGLEQRGVEPHPLLTVGQQARIRSGAFAGMEGVVVRKKGALRVVLTLKQIMQSIAVEVDERDLEPLKA